MGKTQKDSRQGWKLEKQDRFSMSDAYGIESGSTLALSSGEFKER